jgi:predicted alpha/beta hydrolase family esterase
LGYNGFDMKKVFIVHGFEGSPNGGWRPWLMGELEKRDIYACALSMPDPEAPVCYKLVEEISRHINKDDEVYLVGHSLGASAILRYLESAPAGIAGAVLVSGPIEKNRNNKIDSFLDKPFDWKNIKSKASEFVIIHGDTDPNVPLNDAEILSKELDGELIIVKNGGHLNGSSGWLALPQCLNSLVEMMV